MQNNTPELEKELEDLIKQRDAAKEFADDPEAAQAELDKNNEDLTEDERTYAKRYADLRRHAQKQKQEFDQRISALESNLEEARQNVAKESIPISDEELQSWISENPDAHNVIRTVARREAEEAEAATKAELDRVRESLEQDREDFRKRKARQEIAAEHPDFEEIRLDPKYHSWLDDQPEAIQNVMASYDYKLINKYIKLYKLETNQLKTDEPPAKKLGRPRKSDADAARAVSTRNSSSPSDQRKEGKQWTETEIAKLSSVEFEKNFEDIMEARQKGRVLRG